jgi:prolyl-tRNA editing enzyme YbaK/EbsC (Cys-tRNA(Pro) deacylase)
VDTFNLESSSEEEVVEDDFAEEMTKYQREKLSPVPNLVKKKTLIDVVMASQDVISMAERINLSTRKFLMFVADIVRAAGAKIDASTFA